MAHKPSAGKLVFDIFAVLTEFERELIKERTLASMASARIKSRQGRRPYKMTNTKRRLVMAFLGQLATKITPLYEALGISKQTLYRHFSPTGKRRDDGIKLLGLTP